MSQSTSHSDSNQLKLGKNISRIISSNGFPILLKELVKDLDLVVTRDISRLIGTYYKGVFTTGKIKRDGAITGFEEGYDLKEFKEHIEIMESRTTRGERIS